MSRVDVARVTEPADRAAALGVRLAVFVEEQGVPLDLEHDGHDEEADHFLGRLDGEPVAGARLVADAPGTGIAQRVAVLPALRGSGIGATVMRVLEERARERGMTVVELHAQVPVRGFYERLGYVAFGEEYAEAGIPHISMRKSLRTGPTNQAQVGSATSP